MKKLGLVAGLLIAASVVTAPIAAAQPPTPTSCSAALQTLTAAQQKAVLSQAEVDKLKAAQTPLDGAVVAAQKLVDGITADTLPAAATELQRLLLVAKNAAGVGNDKLQAAIGVDTAADAAVVAAQAAADRACQGAPGALVTTTAPAPSPTVVTIPSAINTGRA